MDTPSHRKTPIHAARTRIYSAATKRRQFAGNFALARVINLTGPPSLELRDGTLEALKWIALVLMTGDHLNKYLFGASLPMLFEAGRLAMPLFVAVLAYNLARPGALARGIYRRTLWRLAAFGALATVPTIGLGGLLGGWWPLNILLTLFVLTATLRLLDHGTFESSAVAACLFVMGGAAVEFWWPALAFGVGVWWYQRQPSWSALTLAMAGLTSIGLVNGNHWAFAAIPLVLIASHLNWKVARLNWVFYGYYPLHLSAIWLLRTATA